MSLRWTEQELAAHVGKRTSLKRVSVTTPQKPAAVKRREGRVKGAQPTEVDGLKFPSKREAARYKELQLLKKAESIRRLRRQVMFPLVTKGVPVFPHGYVADFVYEELLNGAWIFTVEDCKGFETEVFRVKERLMKAIYGIEIKKT